VSDRVVEAVWGFFSVYVIVFLSMVTVLMLISDLSFITAFSAVGACLNNLGPGLGDVAANYAGLSDPVKWVLIVAMLLGRLEIFTLLVLFAPAFWRR
jgi:trk system potassium uptake protein TrkH